MLNGQSPEDGRYGRRYCVGSRGIPRKSFVLPRPTETSRQMVGTPSPHRRITATRVTEDKRKVLLWSKEPWKQVGDLGSEALPPGRFVSGTTRTSLGEVTVVGVCIPWPGSRTEKRQGLGRKERWEDHEQYLCHLEAVLQDMLIDTKGKRLMVMGDFNQVIGPGRGLHAPDRLRSMLKKAFPPGMRIVTSELEFQGRGAIDHIALSEGLAVESIDAISDRYGSAKLSDHFGVVASLRESRTVCSN